MSKFQILWLNFLIYINYTKLQFVVQQTSWCHTCQIHFSSVFNFIRRYTKHAKYEMYFFFKYCCWKYEKVDRLQWTVVHFTPVHHDCCFNISSHCLQRAKSSLCKNVIFIDVKCELDLFVWSVIMHTGLLTKAQHVFVSSPSHNCLLLAHCHVWW